jgi:hypothetical protein
MPMSSVFCQANFASHKGLSNVRSLPVAQASYGYGRSPSEKKLFEGLQVFATGLQACFYAFYMFVFFARFVVSFLNKILVLSQMNIGV